MSTSLLIPAWNGILWIGACLQSALRQCEIHDEVIVVDNGSSDGTADQVAQNFPEVNLIRLDHNRGFAGGVNCGLRAARGDMLVLVNQDIVLSEGCLAALKERLAASGPAVAGAKLLYPDGRTIQHGGGIIYFPRGEPGHYGYRQIDDGQFDQARQVDYVTGALAAFSRRVLNTIGPFDEEFFPANYEEVDYCFRARSAGYAIWYEPAAVAVHHESRTQDQQSLTYERTMHRHRLRFVIKNYTAEQLRGHFFPAEMDWLRTQPVDFTRSVMAHAYYRTLLSVRDPAWVVRSARLQHDRWMAAALMPDELAVYLKTLYFNAVRPHEMPHMIWDERRQSALDNLS